MPSRINVYERILKLLYSILKMIFEGPRDPEKVAEAFQAIVDEPATINRRFKRLFTFKLGAVNGKDTLATASEVFQAGIDPNFENWGIVFSGVAPETEMAADELTPHDNFSNYFGSTAAELEKRRLLGSQFLSLCRDDLSSNSDNKLRRKSFANFVLLSAGDRPVAEDLSNVFLAGISVSGNGKLHAYLTESHAHHDDVCDGDNGRRVFSPLPQK